jgi:hypothetical protein
VLLEVALTLEILGLRSVAVANPGLAEYYTMLQSIVPLDQDSPLNLAVKKASELYVQVSIDPEAAELSANYCVTVTWLGVLPHTAPYHWQIALQYLSSN